MREEQNEDSHFQAIGMDTLRAKLDAHEHQIRQKEAARKPSITQSGSEELSASKEPLVIVLEPDREEAYDLWLFRNSYRAGTWHFVGVYQDGLFNLLKRLGYHKRYSPGGKSLVFVRDNDNLLEEVIPSVIRDSVKAYIDANTADVKLDKYTVTHAARSEKFRKSANAIVNDLALTSLTTHERPILRDDAQTCYLPYLNGIVRITKAGIELIPYASLEDQCIWKSHVIPHNYNPLVGTDCHFAHFIANVTNREAERLTTARGIIGYLIHGYNHPSEGQAVIFCDEELTDKTKPQGGTGKGVFVTALMQLRPGVWIDGKKFDPTGRFSFQAINSDTALVCLDDVLANFSFDRFFSILTAGWTIEKKNQPEFTIPQKEGPKLIICTNTAPNNEGSSNIRRQLLLEFSPHYKRLIKPGLTTKPLVAEHGSEFFTDAWDTAEWECFHGFMVECVAEYMRNGVRQYPVRNVNTNRLLQTTSDEFYVWVTTYGGTGLQPNQSYKRPDLLADFRAYAGLTEKDMPSRRFTDFIKKYATSQGWTFELGPSNNNPSFTLQLPSN